MKNTFKFFVVSSAVAVAVAIGCGGSDVEGDTLPRRADADGGSAPSDGGSSTGPSCTGLALQVSDTPACDKCAKDKCCSEVIACNDSSDCKGLMSCIAKCGSSDLQCMLACQTAHDKGAGLLQDLGSCAGDKCQAECPSSDLDANIFGDL